MPVGCSPPHASSPAPYIRLKAILSSKIEGTIATVDDLLLSEVDEIDRGETHRILLTGVRGQDRMPGGLRDRQNAIGGTNLATARFVPPSPTDAMHEPLNDLESFLNEDLDLPP